MTRITAVFFDLGDTLWHFPSMPPVEVIRNETVRRIKELLEGWGEEVTEGRYFLGRDIRMAVEEETSRAGSATAASGSAPSPTAATAARASSRRCVTSASPTCSRSSPYRATSAT